MVGGAVDDQPLHPPDPAVGGMDLLAPPYADLARRERVGDDRRGDVAHAQPVVRQGKTWLAV